MCKMSEKYITLLNYPGSKKRLIEFISSNIYKYVPEGSKLLDIFSGTSAIGYALKDKYAVCANDAEIYCKCIGEALLKKEGFQKIDKDKFMDFYNKNMELLMSAFTEYEIEKKYIVADDMEKLVEFYDSYKNAWQEGFEARDCASKYYLFTTYYSNSYFGLCQSMTIDSIRAAIDEMEDVKSMLLSALYFAMKEAVFAKDGHMAQPLNVKKDSKRMLRCRKVDILNKFFEKVDEFTSDEFVCSEYEGQATNMTLNQILDDPEYLPAFKAVYADPPYTDMQYSRYFHLLDTVTRYDYPEFSLNRGKVSTGLYREGRFQSPLSQHGKAKNDIERLVERCNENGISLFFSYAYPVDLEKQQSNRYTMAIDDLIAVFKKYYPEVHVEKEDFKHANNRNSEAKSVYEYLIIGIPTTK